MAVATQNRKRLRLCNGYEAECRRELLGAAAPHGAQVYTKVRVADVLPISRSGLSNECFSYALRAHFDFVVASPDEIAQFAVEFDGPTHFTDPQTIRRDQLKQEICEHFDLPVLRIDDGFMRRIPQRSLLSWLAAIWFDYQNIETGKSAGEVDQTYKFDPDDVCEVWDSRTDELIEDAEVLSQVAELDENKIPTLYRLRFRHRLADEAREQIWHYESQGLCADARLQQVRQPLGRSMGVRFCSLTRAPHRLVMDPPLWVIGVGSCKTFKFAGADSRHLSLDLARIDLADKLDRLFNRGEREFVSTQADVNAWSKRLDQFAAEAVRNWPKASSHL